MGRLIKVEMKDGSTCQMAPRALDLFLARGEIRRFRRCDGWVDVASGRTRNMSSPQPYSGPERREERSADEAPPSCCHS